MVNILRLIFFRISFLFLSISSDLLEVLMAHVHIFTFVISVRRAIFIASVEDGFFIQLINFKFSFVGSKLTRMQLAAVHKQSTWVKLVTPSDLNPSKNEQITTAISTFVFFIFWSRYFNKLSLPCLIVFYQEEESDLPAEQDLRHNTW